MPRVTRVQSVPEANYHVIEDGKPILKQRVFYHATTKQNVNGIVKNGFDLERVGTSTGQRRSAVGSVMYGSRPNSGSGIYVGKTTDVKGTYGSQVLQVELKPEAKILDVQPYWLTYPKEPEKLPILDDIRAWYPDYVIQQRKKNIPEETDAERQAVRQLVIRDMDETIIEIDPRSGYGKFRPDEFNKKVGDYARDQGYAGVNWDSTDTVIFSNDSIQSISKV